jgi:putative drug exporter of the RND superfamily
LSSLTRWVLEHKRIVVIGWLALTIAGIAASGPASDRLTNDTSVPEKESWETTTAIAERYDGGGQAKSRPLLPVVTLQAGTTVDSPGVKAELAAADARLQKALPDARIASFASTGSRAFVSKDGAHGVRACVSAAAGALRLGREPAGRRGGDEGARRRRGGGPGRCM